MLYSAQNDIKHRAIAVDSFAKVVLLMNYLENTMQCLQINCSKL